MMQDINKAKMIQAIEYIDQNYQARPNICEIAKSLSMSKFHFIRLFKIYTGITPMQFLHLITLNHAKLNLKNSPNLLTASIDIGLSSASRLHDLFVNVLSVTPNEFKNYGNELNITYGISETILRKAILAFNGKGICYFRFMQDEKFGESEMRDFYKNANFIRDDGLVLSKFDRFFNFKPNIDLDSHFKTSNQQLMFWNALLFLATSIKSSGITHNECINFITDKIPLCFEIIKTNVFSSYRWGLLPKKNTLLYEPVNLNFKEKR